MSRVMELHQDWMKDPAFVQEFKKLEEELKRLKELTPRLAGRSNALNGRLASGGSDVPDAPRKRSA